jgi:hypothetical protein
MYLDGYCCCLTELFRTVTSRLWRNATCKETSAVMHSIVSGEQCCNVCTFCCGATVHIRSWLPDFEVSRSHAIRHTHLIWFLWTCTHTIPGAATCTSHNEHKIQKSMPSAGFKPVILPIKQLHNYTTDRTATGIVVYTHYMYIYLHDVKKQHTVV